MTREQWIGRFQDWMHRRKPRQHVDSSSCTSLKSRFSGKQTSKPISEAEEVLQVIADQKNHISCLIIWGSYVRGDDAQYSFKLTRNNSREPNGLVAGPSDLDALIVRTTNVNIPARLEEFTRLTLDFEPVSTIRKNLRNDIIQVEEAKLESVLRTWPEYYVSLYLYSYFSGGLLLKTNSAVNSVFEKLRDQLDYEKIAHEYYSKREQDLGDLLHVRP